jgi:hypothetical protein
MIWPLGTVPKSLAAVVKFCFWVVVCLFFFMVIVIFIFIYLVIFFFFFLIVSFSFGQFVSGVLYFNVTSGALIPEGAQLTVTGGGFLLYRYFSVVYFVR